MPIDDVSTQHEGALQRMSAMTTRDRIGQLHKLDPSGGITDDQGNELLVFTDVAGAANHIAIANASGNKSPSITAVGDDATIDLTLTATGSAGKVITDRLVVGDADDTSTPSEYLGVGTDVDGMLYAYSASGDEDIYLDARKSDRDLFIRANDGGTMKTFLEIDADVALLKLGQNDADITLGYSGQVSVYALRPEETDVWDLGSSSFRFNDIHFSGELVPATVETYTPSNVSTDRSFDADTVAIAELADVVGTLIGDLQTLGLLA